ncbi:MAG: PilZ domain-containing protein [Candidatus Gastranaerophilaceae bacterium]|jgi:c-di-GMP-binding flagellar brake protein YcgR
MIIAHKAALPPERLLMRLREFKIGQQAKVKYSISSIQLIEVICTITRAEIDRICLDFPIQYSELAHYFYEGQEVEVELFTNKGIRKYNSIVIYSPLEGEFVVEYYEDASKIQRREYVRADAMCDLVLYTDKETIKTQTINISGGGLRFYAKKEFTVGDTWNFNLYLPQKPVPVHGSGKIIYMLKKETSYDYSVIEFKNIKEMERNRIMRTCFEIEAEEARSEL